MCAWAGENQSFGATDSSCHGLLCLSQHHPSFLRDSPLGLRGLIWSRSPLPPIPGPAGAFKSSDQVEEFTDVGLQHPVLEIRR